VTQFIVGALIMLGGVLFGYGMGSAKHKGDE